VIMDAVNDNNPTTNAQTLRHPDEARTSLKLAQTIYIASQAIAQREVKGNDPRTPYATVLAAIGGPLALAIVDAGEPGKEEEIIEQVGELTRGLLPILKADKADWEKAKKQASSKDAIVVPGAVGVA
jgi:hypothetical protein